MLTWRPADDGNPAGAGTAADLVMGATQGVTTTFFCPTARNLDTDGGAKNEMSARNTPNTYARGYKEVTTYRLTGGIPWRHRRICFTVKGLPGALFGAAVPTVGLFTQDFYFLYTSSGVVRQTVILNSAKEAFLTALVFKGNQGNDWFSPFNAKVDTQRVSIVSDKTMILNPGNATGHASTRKRWYPMNKRLLYGDDENFTGSSSTPFSTTGKAGMGDFFILDFFQSTLTDSNSGLSVNHEGTYYWHER